MTGFSPLSPSFSTASSSSTPPTTAKSRSSLPASSNPFTDHTPHATSSPGQDKPRSSSLLISTPPIPAKPESNNPFRNRLDSTPLSPSSIASSSTTSQVQANRAPPLPPRKPSIRLKPTPNTSSVPAPTLPPRRSKPIESSSSSINSLASSSRSTSSMSKQPNPPTSLSTPSHLIQQSLLAAENARPKRTTTTTIQVLRRSSDASLLEFPKPSPPRPPPSQDNKTQNNPTHKRISSVDSSHDTSFTKDEIISTVAAALKEAEMPDIKPPPKRRPSALSSSTSTPATSSNPIPASKLSPRNTKFPPGIKKWSCVELLNGSGRGKYAMIILNQPITRRDVFIRAWGGSELRLCADGGGNRLFDLLNPDERESYLPTMIVGDLDSLRPEVRSWYAAREVPIKQDRDEYSTDLMKCIKEIEGTEKAYNQRYSLLFLGGLSGRIDQTVHTMSLMHKLRKTRPETFVLSEESLAWVLDEGSHTIGIDHDTMGQTCGLLPVGVESALVKTTGLKWNLDWVTSFDGEISTSNHLLPSEPIVTISTNHPIFWCIEIKPLPPSLKPLSSSPKSYTNHHSPNHPVQRAKQRTLSNRHAPPTVQEEVSKGIRDLGLGVVKAAEGVKGEIGRLKSGRGGRSSGGDRDWRDRDRDSLVGRKREEEDSDADVDGVGRGDEEVGWKMLD